MNDAPAVEVRNLSKTYRDGWLGGKRIEALRSVDLRVERGEIFGLLGPNGAGKTTMIKLLLGIVRSSAGQARLLGRPAGDRGARQGVGYLPEHHRIPRHHTGNTALEYYGGLSGLSAGEVRRRRGSLLESVGLAQWGKTSVRKYSKGMLQRLGLAQAMLHDPPLLILDEPTDGVDPVGRSEMRSLLERLRDQGKTIFLNSHLLQEIELVCDRVAILDHGRLLRVGPVDELTRQPQTELQFTLAGEETQIRQTLGERELMRFDAAGTGLFNVWLRLPDQSAVNETVDRLRRAEISILAMSPRVQTLEEAFLDIIRQANGSP
jgi:ABC-2 type transport system ATP-binding protein